MFLWCDVTISIWLPLNDYCTIYSIYILFTVYIYYPPYPRFIVYYSFSFYSLYTQYTFLCGITKYEELVSRFPLRFTFVSDETRSWYFTNIYTSNKFSIFRMFWLIKNYESLTCWYLCLIASRKGNSIYIYIYMYLVQNQNLVVKEGEKRLIFIYLL